MNESYSTWKKRGRKTENIQQRFPVQVRLLAMCRGELCAVIARLMPKCP